MKPPTRKELAVIEEMRQSGLEAAPIEQHYRFARWDSLKPWSQDAWLGIARWHLAQLRKAKK